MPLLENLLLNDVNINYNKSSASQEEVGHGLVNSIKTLHIGGTRSMNGVVVLLRFLPSLEKLTIDEAEANEKWNINSLNKSLHKLKYFVMNSENDIRAPTLASLLSYMPSIETFTFSMSKVGLVTNRFRGDLNLTLTYNSLTKLTFKGKLHVLEISGTTLANITKRIPFLEVFNLSNVKVTGDLELSMEQLTCLKKFHVKSKSITGNDIVMIKKLYSCMPLQSTDGCFMCKIELSEPEVYTDISRLYSSRRQIIFDNCGLNTRTLMSALENMI